MSQQLNPAARRSRGPYPPGQRGGKISQPGQKIGPKLPTVFVRKDQCDDLTIGLLPEWYPDALGIPVWDSAGAPWASGRTQVPKLAYLPASVLNKTSAGQFTLRVDGLRGVVEGKRVAGKPGTWSLWKWIELPAKFREAFVEAHGEWAKGPQPGR